MAAKALLKVCQVSTRMNVDDTRQSRVRDAILAAGVQMKSIMTEPRGNSQTWRSPDVSFVILPRTPDIFCNANPFHLIRALAYRFRNFSKAFGAALRYRPDVVHCVEPDSWVIGLTCKCLFGSALVVDFEETYEDGAHVLPAPLSRAYRFILTVVLRFLFRSADMVVHVCESRRENYARIPARRTMLVSHYADLADFETECGPRPPELEGKFVLVHAGAIRATYAGRELLEALQIAAQEQPNLVCLALGGFAHADLAGSDSARELIAKGTLILKKHQAFPDVIRYMKMSDVGISIVLPLNRGLRLAFPRKLFEYFAAGLPVIVSDAPDMVRAVERFKCGIIVDARLSEDIANAILEAARNRMLLAYMAERASVAAQTAYNWRPEARKVTELYREFADKAGKGMCEIAAAS